MFEGHAAGTWCALAAIRRCRVAALLAIAGLAGPCSPPALAEGEDDSDWRIGIEDSNPPLSFATPEGNPDGFSFDVLDALLRGTHINPLYEVKPWPILYQEFVDKKIDVLASASYSPGRQGAILLSSPYFERRTALFLRAGLKPGSPPSLQGLRLAVIAHSQTYDYLASQGMAASITAVSTLDEGLAAVEAGRVDGVLGSSMTGFRRMRDLGLHNVRIHDFNLPGISRSVHFGVRPGEAWRLAILNAGLERLKADGTYQGLRERWIGSYDPPKPILSDLLPYLIPVALFVLVLLAAALGQRRLLKRATASEERLGRVLEGSRLASWDWDFRTQRFTVSSRWHELLGGQPGSGLLVPPDSITSAAAPEYQESLRNALNRLREHGEQINAIFPVTGPARDAPWVHLMGTALLRDSDGRTLLASGTLADVTERMHTIEKLRTTQSQFKRTAELLRLAEQAAHIGAWELDPSSGRVHLSEEAARLLRLDPATIPVELEALLTRLSADSATEAEAAIHRLRTKGEPFDLELTLPPIPAQPSIVRWIGMSESDDSGTVHLYGSIQDITDRRRLENERAAALRRLLETQRRECLGTLAGGIAHDFNNLLTVILSNASLAKLDAPVSHPGSDPLSQIEHAASRAADLCRQMLIYAGQATIDPKPVVMAGLLNEMRGLIDVTVGRRNRLVLEPGTDSSSVLADHRQLRQLILSIVQNAAEACPPSGGSVRIVCTKSVLSSEDAASFKPRFEPDPGPVVCLSVEDDGIGMPADVAERVFEPFFTTKFAGRGLGLAAAHGIVRAHHGAISIETRPHHGTKFRIYLPRVASLDRVEPTDRPHPSTRPASYSPNVALETGRGLLIADDDVSIRNAVAVLARRLGHSCVQASDGSEAYAMFISDPEGFSAVLLDATMPGLPAQELAARIRQMKPDMRIVIMSGYHELPPTSLPSDPLAAMLTKPFTADELAEVLGLPARKVT